MLVFSIKKEWHEKIIYRKVNPHLTIQIAKELCRPMFAFHSPKEVFNKVSALGFKRKFDFRYLGNKNDCILRVCRTRKKLTAYISLIEVVDGKDTDLHIDKPVYAIHFSNVKEAADGATCERIPTTCRNRPAKCERKEIRCLPTRKAWDGRRQ